MPWLVMVLVVLCVVPGDGGKAIYHVSRVHVHLHPMVPMDHLGSKLTRVAQGTRGPPAVVDADKFSKRQMSIFDLLKVKNINNVSNIPVIYLKRSSPLRLPRWLYAVNQFLTTLAIRSTNPPLMQEQISLEWDDSNTPSLVNLFAIIKVGT